MRVLITNNTLASRAGTTSFVRDLARGLQSLGHMVMVYSSDPGQRERLLENDVIPVATDLENMPLQPDVIHAQHHLDAMSAITALPGVPALYHCHGAVWKDCVPRHPRIYRYLAMSRTLAERISVESGIAPSDIEVFLNTLNTTRFREVRQLPARPLKALFYNSRRREDCQSVVVARQAAGLCGVELDLVGYYFKRTTIEPEKLLPQYDIVFASGISAIEAIACGCAVIVLGRTSCGEMVVPENYARIRQQNFSIASNSVAPTVEGVLSQFKRFNVEDCAQVTERLRRNADLDASIGKLVRIYEDLIARHQKMEPDWREEIMATSRYLRKIVPLIKSTDNLLGRNWSSENRAVSFDEISARLILAEDQIKAIKAEISSRP